MDYRGFSRDGDDYHIDDLEVFVWKTKMSDKRFKDWFGAIVEARMNNANFGITKINGKYKWLRKSK